MKKRLTKKRSIALGIMAFVVGGLMTLSSHSIAAPATLPFEGGPTTKPVHDTANDYDTGIFRDSKLGDTIAYCLDYGIPMPYGTLSFKRYLSPELTSVLLNGYPRVSAAQMGLVNNHEAYLATQLAVYQVAQQKGDKKNSTMNFDFANLTANPGYEATTERCFSVAKNMVSKALSNPYVTQTPKLEVQFDGAQLTNTATQIIAGPYKVVASGFDVKEIVASLENAPASAKLTDKNGTAKASFANGEEVYVRMASTEPGSTLKVNFSAKGTRFIGCAYGNSGSSTQDFGTVITEEIEKSTSITVTWKSLVGEIELIKYDQNKDVIAGVKFDLRTLDGTTIDTQITGADGVVRFHDVKPGEYQLVEVAAPNGYIMGTKPITATVKTGEVFKATYENVKMEGGLKIVKKGEDGAPIRGVKFEVLDASKKRVKVITSNVQGEATLEKLPLGNYTFREVEVPSNIILDPTEYPFTISHDQEVITKEIENKYAKGSLKIVKINGVKEPISGAKFEILDANKKVVDTITTGADGTATSRALIVGKYTYREVEAPKNVMLDTKEYPFELKDNGEIVVKEVLNKMVVGTLKIIKKDDYNQPLKGVKFNILDSNKKVVDTLTTNESGIAVSKELPIGNYTYKEVSVPSHIVLDETEYPFVLDDTGAIVQKEVENEVIKGSIKIIKKDLRTSTPIKGAKFDILNNKKEVVDSITTDENGEASSIKLPKGKYYYKETYVPEKYVMDSKEYAFNIETNNQVIEKVVTNKPVEGSLKILKVDESGKAIKGIKFQILDSNKKVVDTITTDENGVAISKELKPGKYYYKEIKAPDYVVLDSTEYEFTIEKDNDIVIKNIVNVYATGKLKIVKRDKADKPIEGVKFEILNEKKEVVDTIATNAAGEAETKPLQLGKYYYKEIEVPENVVLDDKEYVFNIKEHNEVVTKKVVNEKVLGSFKIVKKAKSNGAPIAGVKFQLLNGLREQVAILTTDENGEAYIDNLETGLYFYKEIEAPDEYMKDSNEYNFKIGKNDVVIQKNITNDVKKLPVTGGVISTNVLIVIIVTIVSVTGFVIINIIVQKHKHF